MRAELSKLSAEPASSCEGSQETVEPFRPLVKRELERPGGRDCYDDSRAKRHKALGSLQLEVGHLASICSQCPPIPVYVGMNSQQSQF